VLAGAPFLHEALAADRSRLSGVAGRWRLLGELRRRRFDRAVFSFPSGANAYRLLGWPAFRNESGMRTGSRPRGAPSDARGPAPLPARTIPNKICSSAAALGAPHDAADLWP